MTPTGWERLARRSVVVPAHVAFRQFARETVLLSLRTGRYHAVNGVGARFFETVRDAPDVGRAAEQLAAEFDQPEERIREDLTAFLRDLHTRGLVQIDGPLGPAPDPEETSPTVKR